QEHSGSDRLSYSFAASFLECQLALRLEQFNWVKPGRNMVSPISKRLHRITLGVFSADGCGCRTFVELPICGGTVSKSGDGSLQISFAYSSEAAVSFLLGCRLQNP